MALHRIAPAVVSEWCQEPGITSLRVENERALARAGDAGEHRQPALRDLDADVLEVVLACGEHADQIFASRSLSPSAFFLFARASAFYSLARSLIAARSSSVNPLDFFALIVPSCAGSSVSYSVQQEKSTCGSLPSLLDF